MAATVNNRLYVGRKRRNGIMMGLAYLATLFGAGAASIAVTRRQFAFRYRSPAHFIEVFRTWYGPMHKAFAALPPEGAKALERDLIELLSAANVSDEGVLTAPSDYLEVVVTKA